MTPRPNLLVPGDVTPSAATPTDEVSERWWSQSADDVVATIGSGPGGLDGGEAARRLAQHGPNELVERGARTPFQLIWEQLTAVMVLILIGASALSLLLGKFLEAGAVATIVVLFVVLGFVQEYRAEQAIAALRRMSVPVVRAVRSGQVVELPAGDLVPGDVVVLEAGNVVPADLRLIETVGLRIQEAALTGESEPVDKHTAVIPAVDPPLGDRANLAFSGTQVTYGRGRGVVVATGMQTELGRIATLLQSVETKSTPLQERLDRVGKQLALVGLAVAAIVVAMGAVLGEPAADLVLTAISVAVAVIPEGLPAVVTFTLALGAQRMLRRNALIRKLPAVETLGSVTVICSDKTGTLTQNHMTATIVDVAGETLQLEQGGRDRSPAATVALLGGLLCNDGEPTLADDGSLSMIGDPTETALIEAAHRVGIDVLAVRSSVPRLGDRPFDSERKRMSTVHAVNAADTPPELRALSDGEPVAFVKGAADGLLAHTVAVLTEAGTTPVTDEWRRRILDATEQMARKGMRVLGVAFRTLPDAGRLDLAEDDLTFVGLVGIIDPPRAEVRDAVARCVTAGVRTVMITGDHPLTAAAIAADLGISTDDRAMTGAEIERLDEAGLAAAVQEINVFARVSPEHKLRIVEALQAQGAIVAMTGDGVNDAPALKTADIGVAMGITGTDVSKEASDIVLRDDNFSTIVAAVEEGRVIYDNLRRFVKFAVAGNIGKILVMVGWPIPLLFSGGDLDQAVALLPLQLLWLNLMTDGLLGLSLGVEPAERNVMQRPPHTPGGSIWANGVGRQTLWTGVLIGAISLAVGLGYEAADRIEWQTMMFTTLAFLQVFQALGTRSSTDSLRTIGLGTNRLMLGLGGVVIALQLVALYTPLNDFLDLEPLAAIDLALCVALGVALLVVLEAEKAWRRRKPAAAIV